MNKPLNQIIAYYHLYPLGLCDALNDPTPKDRFDILYKWLDHIHDMGCDMIQIGPVFSSLSHGYDTVDYYHVDPRLGNDQALIQWIAKAHQYGISIIMDTVFNHVSRSFFAFQDLLKYQQSSKYIHWFNHVDFGQTNAHHDPFSYQGWRGIEDLVTLNLTDPEVKQYLFDVATYWIETFDIDGMRLDSADVMDFQFLKALKAHCRTIKSDFLMVGEVIHGDYGHIIRSSDLDTLTNYALHKAIYSAPNSHNWFELAHNAQRLYGPYGLCQNIPLVTFADNHDVNRIIDMLNDPRDLTNVYTYIFTSYGIPSIYYGSEFAIHGKKIPGSDAPLRPALTLSQLLEDPDPLYDHICSLIKLRHDYMDAFAGNEQTVVLTNTVFAYVREGKQQKILVILSNSDHDESIMIPFANGSTIHPLYQCPNFSADAHQLSMVIPPHSGCIFSIDR